MRVGAGLVAGLLLCALGALGAVGDPSGPARSFPVTVRSCGRPVSFVRPPQRAVFNDIDMAEMAFALGLQPSLAGISGVSGWYHLTPAFVVAQGRIPELAPRYPALEQLVAVRADLFVAGWYYGMTPGGEVTPDTLAAVHIPTLELTESCIHIDRDRPPASLDLLYGDELRLGRVFGRERQAEALVAGWRSRVAAIEARVAGRGRPLVFVYDSGRDKPFTAGRYAMASAIIDAAGGTNVLDDMPTNWGSSSWETVALRNPQFVVLLDYQDGGGAASLLAFLRAQPAMRLLGAVRDGRVLPLRYEQLTPGPADIDAIERLARALHPGAFSRTAGPGAEP